MPEFVRHDAVVLDACCIITLAATGEFESILSAISTRFIVSPYVAEKEALTFIDATDPDKQEIPIDLQSLIDKGVIEKSATEHQGLHFVQEDSPDAIGQAVAEFVG